ncbi:MAG: hypothetical protein NTV51_30955 [Verrucomicrobia bacterium]|nr:hypothetical protein [Verrucomicrobiota bacterium]
MAPRGKIPVTELEARIGSHPNFLAAKSHFHCSTGEVFMWKRADIERFRLAAAIREKILDALGTEESSPMLLYQTSDVKPEPLAGHGLLYAFIFHPQTHELLASDVSNWRS